MKAYDLEGNIKYEIVEIFQSINGEGMKAGELAAFIRFKGCNLGCGYCDTMWANQVDASCREMDEEEIIEEIEKYHVKNVTVTGGEPLFRKGIGKLLKRLIKEGFAVEIETNGSVSLREFAPISPNISFTMDYKLPGSGMEENMCVSNFSLLTAKDTVKFVVSGREDLERAYQVTEQYSLGERCHVLLSPVFGEIEPEEIVEFMKQRHWTEVRMQIQMHKVIWDANKRGV